MGCVLYEIITLRTPFRGDDMDTMYRKIVKGVYPRIPAYFSIELSQIIKLLLQVNPSLRLSCDKILLLPLVSKFLEEKHFIQMNEGIPFLLKTIRMTKKMNLLSESLPKPNYDSLKMIFVNKKQFFKTIDNGKTFRDDNYTESSDKDFAKKLLNLIGTKKGSVLPRINKSKLIEDHNKRYNDIAPLYQEEIFFIKAIGINPKIKNKKPNVSKSCQNNTKLFTDESQTELKESRTKLENKKDDDQIKQNKKLIKIFLPKI